MTTLIPKYDQGATGAVNRPFIQKLQETISVLDFGAVGNGTTDDTTAFTNFINALSNAPKGTTGYIPASSNYYNIPNGLVFNGLTSITINSDINAKIIVNNNTAASSGYAITFTNWQYCNFNMPNIVAGYSGVLINAVGSPGNSLFNQFSFNSITTNAPLPTTKPTTPGTNSIGICVLGPVSGSANYYNTINYAIDISGFDTGVALNNATSVLNSNANNYYNIYVENSWVGIYINGVENNIIGARFYNVPSQANASNIANAIEIGNGTSTVSFNYIQAVTESNGSIYMRGLLARVNTYKNIVFIQDNQNYASLDYGTNNIFSHSSFSINNPINFVNNGTSTIPAISGTVTNTGIYFPSTGNVIGFTGSVAAGVNITEVISSSTGIPSTYTNAADTTGANSANTVLQVNKISATGRSISAAGTINASGADYAEYMVKAGNFTIKKGDICGIDANGKLTNVFANAISFVVKSTTPSYVGGDTWGYKSPTEQYTPEELEAIRETVDRIAFAGQVPVNVTGAIVGQYIVPIANADGSIGSQVVSESALTLQQYMQSVGKVISVVGNVTTIIVKVA